MIPPPDEQRVARAVLTYLAEPGNPVLCALLDISEPVDVVTAVTAGRVPGAVLAAASAGRIGQRDLAAVQRAIARWQKRLGGVPAEIDLAGFHRDGIRLVCPGDPEWPTQLDALGVARPYALWLRGQADLRYCCLRSVAIVGSRAATAYGTHVGTEMAAALAARGWTVISGGAYGIDGAAHRGALAADGVTIAVLACGVDYVYPRGHANLFAGLTAQGVLVSEWPPGRPPTRHRFLIRNRVIGALSRGTVVVEAGLRSGALNTARHARDLGRPVMAVPGPVTSEVSAGCHKIIREWAAVCVTGAHDVIELLTPFDSEHDEIRAGGHPDAREGERDDMDSGTDDEIPVSQPPFTEPVVPRAALDAEATRVLEAMPSRGAGPAAIAVSAGLSVDAVVRSLGLLAACGFVERCAKGWRVRRRPSEGGRS
jgi:DNA processing protein